MRISRRWLPRVLVICFGMAVGILLGEVVGRVVLPRGGAALLMQSQISPAGMYAFDPEVLYAPVPGFSATARSLEGTVEVRLNTLGLRGAEPGHPWKQRRWLVIGDSFALSLQVPEQQTFAHHLQTALGEPYRVFNGGVDGYSTWQATGRYQQVDTPLNSGAVLLMLFLGNDIYDNAWFPEVVRHWRPQDFRPPESEGPLVRWLLEHSFLFAQLRVAQRRLALAEDAGRMERWREELALFTQPGHQALRAKLPFTRQALAELRRETAQRGDALVVALAPPVFVVEPQRAPGTLEMVGFSEDQADLHAPRRALRSMLEELDVETCDLTEPLRAAEREGIDSYLRFDGHWSARGHQVVAEALLPCLQRADPWTRG